MMKSPKTPIYYIRKQLNIQQKDFAKLLGITKSYMSYIESGKRRTSLKIVATLKNICRVNNIGFKAEDFL